MEENVALDTTKQRKFVKSIKGIKKLIKKQDGVKSEDAVSPKAKDEKPKRKRPDRGLVYLSHIPHGFYEHEMTQYFKQFGMVTNVRVIRSKRTGNSKGFAFVEFKEPAVAEIVAETMNNYLMGKRLIKAAYVPPEKQRPKAMRKHWSRLNNPGSNARLKMKKAYNENKDEKGELKRARKILSNINKTKKKLSELGISYDFFTPVDMPEALQNSLKKENEVSNEIKENTIKVEKKSKKNKKTQNLDTKDKIESLKKNVLGKVESQMKPEKTKAAKTEAAKEPAVKMEDKKSVKSKKENKKSTEQEPVVNKKEQNKKQQKLKDAGVKPPENFIRVQEESQDSDSSLDFDSDEYEKMLQEDSDESEPDEGGDGDDSDEPASDDDDESNEEEEDIVPPPKKSKGQPVLTAVPQMQGKMQKGQLPEQNKRKTPQKPSVVPKKPKFEKQMQKPMKKQFKKKK